MSPSPIPGMTCHVAQNRGEDEGSTSRPPLYHSFLNLRFEVRELLTGGKTPEGGKFCTKSNVLQVKSKQQKLVISTLLKAHEGKYTCTVSNKWGELQHSTVVEGLEHSVYAPKVIEKPDNQTVAVGMDTHLKCVVDSGSLVPSIRWAEVEEGGNDSRPNVEKMIPEYRNKEELVLRNVTKKDQGLYACVIITDAGKTLEYAYVDVLEDYEAIQQAPVNKTAAPGTNVNFHCRTPLAIQRYIHWVRLLEADIEVLSEESQVGTSQVPQPLLW